MDRSEIAKKILIVSSSFYPMNSPRSFRTTELVKGFARKGHEVTLLTHKDNGLHNSFEKKYGVTIKDLGPYILPSIDTSHENRYFNLFKRALNRGLNLLFEYPHIELMFSVKKALKNEYGYDLLISIAVPHPTHWGVAWARSEKHPIANTWIADCGDPYMGANLDSFNKLFYFKYFEKWFCKKADKITIPVESARAGYYPKFHNKIKVIPQGFDFNEVDIDHSSYSKNEVPTFGYAGSLIPGGRDPRPFLDYLVRQKKDYKFILYTKTTKMVEPYVNKSDGRIEIKDYIPREKLLKNLSKMDFVINFENESELMMPSKLVDYYLTGRPVLSISGSNFNKDVIDQFLEGNYKRKYSFQEMHKHKIENVCNRFLELSEH